MENIRTFIQTKNKEYKELLASNAAEDKQYEENIKAIEKSIHRFFIESREILEERKKSTFEKIGITAEEWEANQAAYNEICEAAIAELDSWYSFKKEKLEKKYKSDLSSLQISRDRESIVNELEGNATAADTKQAIAVLSNDQNKYREEINLIINKYKISLQQLYQNSSYTDISRHQIPAELFEKIREYYRLTNKIHTLDREYSIDNSASLSYYDKREKEISAEYTAKKEALEKDYHKKSAEIRKGVEELNSLAEKIVWIERQQNTGVQNIGEDIHSNQYLTDEQSRELYELRRKRTELLETHQSVKITNEKRLSEFLDGVKEKLLSYKDKESDYQIKTPSEYKPEEQLPETICIGEYTTPMEKCELTNALFEQKQFGTSNSIFLDVRNCGNIIINTHSYEDETNETLYRVVSGLALRYLQSFPIGSLKVHFVDVRQREWFTKFEQGFKSNNAGIKKIVNYSSTISEKDMAIINDSCSRISKKLDGYSDLFELSQEDDTELFQLVVIRSGFSEYIKRINFDSLNKFTNLFEELGNKGGVRFIIVNDCQLNERREEEKEFKLHTILDNSLQFTFKENILFQNEQPAVVTTIPTQYNSEFVSKCCECMRDVLETMENRKISYKEIKFGEVFHDKSDFAELKIPVGKYGGKDIEVPFNCTGGNIGLMTIGTTGFGKSSLYHSIIINGCMKYSPDDLEIWLMDFKSGTNGGDASTKYMEKGIPHITVISLDNTSDETVMFLDMLKKEQEKRLDIFQRVGHTSSQKTGFSDISTYNAWVDKNPESGKHMPRILVLVDEAQDMCDKSTKSEVVNRLGQLARVVRSVGIHILLFAQNLESGHANNFKEEFIPHGIGMVSFRLENGKILHHSFGEKFAEVESEISQLGKGECYCSFVGDNDTKKAKIAYCPDVAFDEYFSKIRTKYDKYPVCTKYFGRKDALLPSAKVSDKNEYYSDLIKNPFVYETNTGKKEYRFTIGEDVRSLNPVGITYDTKPGSSVCILGSDERLRSSLLSSIMLSSIQLDKKKVYICDGSNGEDRLFDSIVGSQKEATDVQVYSDDNVDELFQLVYSEYLTRVKNQKEGIIQEYQPIFVIINRIAEIEKIADDVMCVFSASKNEKRTVAGLRVSSSNKNLETEPLKKSMDRFYEVRKRKEAKESNSSTQATPNRLIEGKKISELITELIKNGSRRGIYLTISTYEIDSKLIAEIYKSAEYKVIFKSINLKSQPYECRLNKLEELVNKLSTNINDDGKSLEETKALFISRGNNIIFRPILYAEMPNDLPFEL